MAPIIIVPKGYDTKINMFNAQARIDLQSGHVRPTHAWASHSSHGSCLMAMLWAAIRLQHVVATGLQCVTQAFLEDGRYIPWQECQEQGIKKASRVSFKRTIGRSRPVRLRPAHRRIISFLLSWML